MTNGFTTTGLQNILLLGMNIAEREHISNLLVHDGYKPQHASVTWFREHQIVDNPQLIIVDTLRRGNKVINTVRKKLLDDSGDRNKHVPPILAVVDTCLRHKQEVFDYGAADYVSCPLITAEFSYRVEHAIDKSRQKNDVLSDHADLPDNKVVTSKADKPWPINTDHVLAIETANYLKVMIEDKVSLVELAKNMATNRNKLSRAFKSYYGVTVFDWLREQRMMVAAELLRFTNDTVQQIAERSGYPDSNNFATTFKRTFHLSPSQYRKVQQTKNVVHRSKAP